ncbi:MAG: CDP-alcohol phosphatidyltransferase family protein [Spirochaetaceae bacterium]|jgi:CDP-diacylglycerol--glycerol-3-phosphate 3-phosphatidyltransferase|nr:CDP-alcohol phosphatidyltransferase family protein [Spirochaetaceae bacterium]
MLDTSLRKHISFLFDGGAAFFEKLKISPICVTFIAFVTGLIASGAYLLGFPLAAVVVLWISGWLDAVDGTLARRTGKTSKLGAFLDVWFDRAVEGCILLSLGIKHPGASFSLLCSALAIILSMTAFLLTGAFVENKTKKSFFYQSGIMERSEGFIIFSLMWLLPKYLDLLSYLCAALILFTACQRVLLTVLALKQEGEKP